MKNMKPLLSITLAIIFLTIQSFAEHRSNGKIAFTSSRDGNSKIYVMNADGTDQTRITNSIGSDDFPAWSPNGQKIAFVRRITNPVNSLSIMLMNPDGSDQRQITTSNRWGSSFQTERFGIAWSPDGTRIAFQDGTDIFTVDTNGNGRVNLTNGQFINFEPSWSPDGNRIAFARSIYFHGYYPDVYTMSVTGGDVRQVTQSLPYSESTSPDWSADGTQLTLLSGADSMDNSSLATIGSNGGDIQFVLFYGNYVDFPYDPEWSPDGTKIIFAGRGISSSFSEIWTINPTTRALTKLTSGFTNDYRPDWQPIAAPFSSVSGRVLAPNGMALRNAAVTLTDASGSRVTATTSAFGLFRFDGIRSGGPYTISVGSKRYRFGTRTFFVDNDLTLTDIIGLE